MHGALMSAKRKKYRLHQIKLGKDSIGYKNYIKIVPLKIWYQFIFDDLSKLNYGENLDELLKEIEEAKETYKSLEIDQTDGISGTNERLEAEEIGQFGVNVTKYQILRYKIGRYDNSN